MSHYWEDILNLLPVFCTAKYRGGVRRTEGLKNSDNNKPGITLLPCRAPQPYETLQNSIGKKTTFQSSPPVFLQGI